MTRWISLKVGWKLQDVQAGLNVIIAFLCAGGIFVLVRYCWLIAARRVAEKKDVPAYSLLSLNTIGETIDVIWLLRYDLFATRYHGLLLQVICVMLLTCATLTSGFIARFSTRNGDVLRNIEINGTLAQRNVQSIPYAEAEINITMTKLQEAQFPQDRLLEYMPDPNLRWEYDSEQWNSSWSMDCTYSNSTPFENPVATSNCSNGMFTQLPFVNDQWDAFATSENGSYYEDDTGWRNNGSVYRDWIIFVHGMKYDDWDSDIYLGMTMQTVAWHLMGLKVAADDGSGCSIGPGKIVSASYTSATCKMTRRRDNRAVEDLVNWGAYPDGFDATWQVAAYIQHYGNRFRKESSKEQDVTIISGEELAMFYQAYMITKDTSFATYLKKTMLVHVRVAQISLTCLIACSIAAGLVLFGLVNYWFFLFRHWKRLDQTPQSKLDWMLQTLRKEHGVENPDSKRQTVKQRLSQAMASGNHKGEAVPLTRVGGGDQKEAGDRRSVKSAASSHFMSPELNSHGDDGFDTPILSASFSGKSPTNTWLPQQYERVSPDVRQGSWSSMGRSRNSDYNPVQQHGSPYMWQGTHQVDTTYDPGKRWN